MKTDWQHLEKFRIRAGGAMSYTGDHFGAFMVPGPYHKMLQAVVSSAFEEITWEHVSVSTRGRCPNWDEMDFIKRLFWDDSECAMQLHVPRTEHVNCHPYCLHIWKPTHVEIPQPPSIMVGPGWAKVKDAQ